MVFKRTVPVSAQGLSLNHRSMDERLHKVAEQLNKNTDNALWDFTAHPNPPTISNSSSQTITSNYEEVHGWELNRYTQLGSLPRLNASNYIESNTSGTDNHRVIYGFTLVGTEVEIAWRAATNSESVWIWVDGQPITTAPGAPSGITVSAGNTFYTKITFGSPGTHQIVVYPSYGQIKTFRTATATSAIEPLVDRPDCSIFSLGDSQANASATAPYLTTWNWRLALCLGFEHYHGNQGGTGYVASGSGGARAATDASRLDPIGEADPDLVLISLGGNDATQTPSAVQAAATAVYQGIASRAPNAPVIVTGRYVSNSTDSLSSSRALVGKAIYDAAMAAPNVVGFIDMIGVDTTGVIPAAQVNGQTYQVGDRFTYAGGVYEVKDQAYTGTSTTPTGRYVNQLSWLTGTGNAGSVANNGTRDLGLSSDGVHWSALGQSIWASRMAAELRRILASYL